MSHQNCASLVLAFALLLRSGLADVFVVPEAGSDKVRRISSGGTGNTVLASGLNVPLDAVYDAAGRLHVAEGGTGKVLQFPAGSGVPVQIGDAVAGLVALAFDGSGVLHVASTDRTIRKLSGNTFATLVTLPAGASPRGIAFAPDGSLFVADFALNRVRKITAAGAQSEFSDDVTAPFGVAFDAGGKLHVTDAESGGRIANFNPNGRARAVASGLGAVRGLGFDRSGALYYATAAGSLRQVVGNSTVEIAGGLNDPRLFTVRAVQARIVAFKGQSLVEPNGAQFATFGSPALGGGFAAFKAALTAGVAGVASTNALGLWRAHSSGMIELLARQAFPAPGVAGAVFAGFGDPILNESGKVAFLGTLKAGVGGVTTANAHGIWTDTSGALALLSRKGDAAPGLAPTAKFAGFKQIVLLDDAGPAFLAKVAGPGLTSANNLGLWSADTNGALMLIVRKGDAVTVNGAVKTIATLRIFSPTPLSLGQGRHLAAGRKFTFLAKFTDGSQAVLLAQPSLTPVVLAYQGESVGPAVSATTFKGFGSPCVSAEGTSFAVFAKLTPGLGDVTRASATAIFRHLPARQLDARKTFPAPGTSSAIFAALSEPVTNAAGGLAFLGKLTPGLGDATSANAVGLWADTGAGVSLVARKGGAAPGIKGGGVSFASFKQFVLPDTGGLVFTAIVAGGGITTANNLGLWAGGGAGGLELFLRTGDPLKVNDGNRTVASFKIFQLQPGVGGHSRNFSDDGSVACLVKCTDGMQAVVHFQQP